MTHGTNFTLTTLRCQPLTLPNKQTPRDTDPSALLAAAAWATGTKEYNTKLIQRFVAFNPDIFFFFKIQLDCFEFYSNEVKA